VSLSLTRVANRALCNISLSHQTAWFFRCQRPHNYDTRNEETDDWVKIFDMGVIVSGTVHIPIGIFYCHICYVLLGVATFSYISRIKIYY